MKELINNLNRLFESRIRLGVMSILMINDWVDFNSLKENLNITDGNLASHIKALEEAGYIEIKKQFVKKKPNTSYRVTLSGRNEFENHLKALEEIIKSNS